jgi:feruloyl esterase
VRLELEPSGNSHIVAEIWLPESNWNGKYLAQGNGVFAGYIDYDGMTGAILRGYATSATDTGHHSAPANADWARGHPEKVIDFGYRAIHETAETAKTIIAHYYGRRPRHSYFASCSNGGRQGLMEAQRFPADYDGILAGAPAHSWTQLFAALMENVRTLNAIPGARIPNSKIPAIAAAVLQTCDGPDGLKDGLVSDPRECRFDPAALQCRAAESDACLTSTQIASLRILYSESRTTAGERIFPGLLPGAETGRGGWEPWITGSRSERSLQFTFATNYFRNMVYEDPAWNYRSFRLENAVQTSDRKLGPLLNATNPDLSRFANRGGKLILYHGWNDPVVPALSTIDYYDAVVRTMGTVHPRTFVRLYMVPGMQHCEDGPGPNIFGQSVMPRYVQADDGPGNNIFRALEEWVEHQHAPAAIVAVKYADDADSAKRVQMTRPLCPYPEKAVYKGAGNPNESGSFSCSAAR